MEPEKAHAIYEFVVVVRSGGHVLLHLFSGIETVVRQVSWQTKMGLDDFFKFCIRIFVTAFLFLGFDAKLFRIAMGDFRHSRYFYA